MKKAIIQTNNIITKVNKFMVNISGIIVALMSILITIDVLLRYVFSAPTSWIFNLSTIGTGYVALLLGGYALAMGKHIRVDFFFEKFSLRVKSIIDLISFVLVFLIALCFVLLGTDYVIHYYQIGAVSSGGLDIPLWILWLMIPIGGLLIGLQSILKLIEDIYIIIKGEKLYKENEEVQ